jgi:hypothetical protein
MTTTIDELAELFSGTVDAATAAGACTPEIKQQLLERRWSFMNRKVAKPLIRLWDKEFDFICYLDNLDGWSWEEMALDDGEATVEWSGSANDWIREIILYQTKIGEDLHVTFDIDPTNPTDWKNRWGGKVLIIEDEQQTDQVSTTKLHCISNRRHLRGILLKCNPIFPDEVQIPKMYLFGGPCAFTCGFSAWINLFQMQTLNNFSPIPRNIFDPSTWLNEVSPLNWPIQVMPINPILDQSRWEVLGARYKDCQTIFSPIMQDAGVICRAYTWLPGDPAPYQIFGAELAEILKPTRACIILSFEDKSGYAGPTGTALDGALNLFASTLDDLISEVIFPLDSVQPGDIIYNQTGLGGDEEDFPFFETLLGVAPTVPPLVLRDIGYGNIAKRKMVIHKQQGTDIAVGGKSPAWLNMAISFAIQWGLAQLQFVVSEGFGVGGGEIIGAGLSSLYQGQLSDVFLAFFTFTNPIRSADAGSYALRYYMEAGDGTAFTISSVQSLAIGDWKMRAYMGMKFDVGTGPLFYGLDFGVGDRLMAEIRGIYYVDQIMSVKAMGSRTESGRPFVSFGDDTREQDPIARAFANIGNVTNFVQMMATGGGLF